MISVAAELSEKRIEVNIDCKQKSNDSFAVNKLEKCKSCSGVKQK